MNRQEKIIQIANKLYRCSGFKKGRDIDNWLEAERLVNDIEALEKVFNPASPHVRKSGGENMDRNEQIATLAYELYVKSGFVEGRDLDNWLEAEKMIENRSIETGALTVHEPAEIVPVETLEKEEQPVS